MLRAVVLDYWANGPIDIFATHYDCLYRVGQKNGATDS